MSHLPLPAEQNFDVLLFASLRDIAGERLTIEMPAGADLTRLLEEVSRRAPAIAAWLPHVRVAVNCEYAKPNQILQPGDEIALLPPVSGGAGICTTGTVEIDRTQVRVSDAPLDAQACVERAQKFLEGGAGAIVPFIGVVRNHARGQHVTHLEYQAYESMAEAEMKRIAVEAAQRWQCACVCEHRTGRLGIGEASLIVVVAGAHRAETFEACRWTVDEIKLRVPVWKKEFAANGASWIEEPLQSAPEI
jgi:molybdopterin synthase catalytic subunit